MGKEQQQDQPSFDQVSNKGKGMQGIDKAPGEEPAQGTENPVPETQKGKKVDGDPSQESDQPLSQS